MIRHYHGHLSAVQGLTLHPSLDILITCARDATARVSVLKEFEMNDYILVAVIQGIHDANNHLYSTCLLYFLNRFCKYVRTNYLRLSLSRNAFTVLEVATMFLLKHLFPV